MNLNILDFKRIDTTEKVKRECRWRVGENQKKVREVSGKSLPILCLKFGRHLAVESKYVRFLNLPDSFALKLINRSFEHHKSFINLIIVKVILLNLFKGDAHVHKS